jgi:hypothetical protein
MQDVERCMNDTILVAILDMSDNIRLHGRSHWPRGLRHELSSSLERWDRGFESHSTHGCLCAFILCLCCSVCR